MKLVQLIVLVGALFILIATIYLASQFLYPLIVPNITILSPDLTVNLALSFMISLLVAYCFRLLVISIPALKWDNWTIVTIFLITLSIGAGFSFINRFVGFQPLNLVLRDELQNFVIVGNMTCNDYSGKLLANDVIYCNTTPKLHDYQVNVSFNFNDGSSTFVALNNTPFFTAPPNVKRISFFLAGLDEKNVSRKLQVSNDFTFYTSDEQTQRNNQFLAYMLALIAIVAFSIPEMMVNLRDLFGKIHEKTQLKKCVRCKGKGVITDKVRRQIKCPICNGKGWNRL